VALNFALRLIAILALKKCLRQEHKLLKKTPSWILLIHFHPLKFVSIKLKFIFFSKKITKNF